MNPLRFVFYHDYLLFIFIMIVYAIFLSDRLVMCDICSVSQLVPPGEEEITVCERNGKLISITDPLLIDAYMDGEVCIFSFCV